MDKICTGCNTTYTQKTGERIVCGAMTQRELAEAKRVLYEAERTLQEIEQRKKEFMQKATDEANKVVAAIEQQVGKPMKQLRQERDMMAQRLQEYMTENGRTEMLIRDMLVEVKNVVVNRGNAPLWSQITEKMAALIGWSEEELSKFVKANYSIAKFADQLSMTFLPPGERARRKKEKEDQGGITSAYRAEELDIPKIAEIETAFLRTGARTCRVETPTQVFLLTGSFVQAHGLAHMISVQKLHKQSLRVEDMEREGGATRVLITRESAYHPNSVPAHPRTWRTTSSPRSAASSRRSCSSRRTVRRR